MCIYNICTVRVIIYVYRAVDRGRNAVPAGYTACSTCMSVWFRKRNYNIVLYIVSSMSHISCTRKDLSRCKQSEAVIIIKKKCTRKGKERSNVRRVAGVTCFDRIFYSRLQIQFAIPFGRNPKPRTTVVDRSLNGATILFNSLRKNASMPSR